MPNTALILGAGFSFAAGVPLTRDLFDCTDLPLSKSDKDEAALEEVQRAYRRWKVDHPEKNAEEWLAALAEAGIRSKDRLGTTWDNAIQFALRRLVKLKNAHPEPYYHGICTSFAHPTHARFWQFVTSNFDLKTIVTLNYDILIEQALHEGSSEHRTAPDCYYGGFAFNQIVMKMINVAKRESVPMRLGHKYKLYKLHGSINWAWEHSTTMKVHDDVRAIFRRRGDYQPAIVAPVPEKDTPEFFLNIWREASVSLAEAETWIVCGYSMPDYDIALRDFFHKALGSKRLRHIFILDPYSQQLSSKWRIPGSTAEITCLPGLPHALDADKEWFGGSSSHSVTADGQYQLFS